MDWLQVDCKRCRPTGSALKSRQFFQVFDAPVNCLAGDARGEFQTEAFATKRGGDTAAHHRPANVGIDGPFRRGKITHHAADK